MARRYVNTGAGIIERTIAADPGELANALQVTEEKAREFQANLQKVEAAKNGNAGSGGGQQDERLLAGGQTPEEEAQRLLAQMLREKGPAAVSGRPNLAQESGRPGGARASATHPLAYTGAALDELQAALNTRRSSRVVHNATLTTSTLGAGREWAANVMRGPRVLHVATGVPQTTGTDAIYAQYPQFTLPTATGSVAEGVTVTEYAASAAGSLTMGRFGRFTDLSQESQIGADAEAIIAMHQLGVAKDLDKVLIDAVETAAGAAVAFSADVPAAIRKAMALVIDNTAAENAADLVILVHPDNAALLQDVAPIGGETVGEGFQRFGGALVYPSSATNTGFMTVANLSVGCRYFEAQGLQTETDMAVKTSVLTTATSIIAGYGVSLVSGFASMVDVVTP